MLDIFSLISGFLVLSAYLSIPKRVRIPCDIIAVMYMLCSTLICTLTMICICSYHVFLINISSLPWSLSYLSPVWYSMEIDTLRRKGRKYNIYVKTCKNVIIRRIPSSYCSDGGAKQVFCIWFGCLWFTWPVVAVSSLESTVWLWPGTQLPTLNSLPYPPSSNWCGFFHT